MSHHTRRVILLGLCILVTAGCSGPKIKDSRGRRTALSGYDRISVQPVEVATGINHPGLSEDLTTQIQDRLRRSNRWTLAAHEPGPAGATKDGLIDLAVTVVKAKYPSRSKSIWLGSAHKMTCRVQVRDHATGDLLGSAKVSSSVEPFLGNAALLNFGAVGILGRTAFDTREHDTMVLHEHVAKEITQALDRAKI